MMTLPIRGGRITSTFDEPRPLEGPKTHVHGAVDITDGDWVVRSPVYGEARGYVFLRQKGSGWADKEKPELLALPFRNYFYDVYGGLIVIVEDSGRMHIMTHFYAAQLQTWLGEMILVESNAESRWPSVALISKPLEVARGQQLSRIGNAGYSTGPHVHWEIHSTPDKIDDYADRIRPSAYVE